MSPRGGTAHLLRLELQRTRRFGAFFPSSSESDSPGGFRHGWRKSLVLVLAAAFASLGAEYRTPAGNFVVSAPTPEIAQQIGQYAEYYRKEKAMLWLGQEMPQWPDPIPLRVTILRDGSSGATEFGFDRGYILQPADAHRRAARPADGQRAAA